ncbi:MAG: DUF2842 domain-containing protein [Pseudomonadota bacterium]
MRTALPIRMKKLIGGMLLVVLVFVYSLAAVSVASATIATSPWYVHLAFFFVGGFLWILPAMVIIKWMSTEPA